MKFSTLDHIPTTSQATSRKRKRGFTAVETVIGAILMTVLISSMLHMLKQGNYLVELARDNTRVTQMLQSEIEDLRTLNWNDLKLLAEFDSFTPQGAFVSTYANEYYCYRFVNDTVTDQKEVFVVAVWYDSMNRSHLSWFRTLFSKDGLNDYYYRSV
ncbi:MAG: hypothetical protein O7C75_03805 [Verrucomicrobia bacterium]|nr:hypothetical protein [Verrucomicrobiota bacterium]